MTFKQQIEEYLSDIPSKWKNQLVQLLCEIKEEKVELDCNIVKDCETLTTLSNFTISGETVCITYTGEDSVPVNRCFSLSEIIKQSLDLDPNCLTDETTWSNLTLSQQIQLLIDSHCDCCSTSTTTTIPTPR